MILLALVPPLWNRVMDPRVAAHFDGDMSLANIQPGKRDRIMRRFPLAPAGGSSPAAVSSEGTVATLVRAGSVVRAVETVTGPLNRLES